jgi:hypothetical protein
MGDGNLATSFSTVGKSKKQRAPRDWDLSDWSFFGAWSLGFGSLHRRPRFVPIGALFVGVRDLQKARFVERLA